VAASSQYRKFLQYLLFAAVVIWIAIGLQSWNNDTGAVKAARDRKPVPDVALPQLDGNSRWRLSDHHGQVVLINYWATWCAPCRQEMPGLAKLARDYQPKNLAVVGVSMDEGGRSAVQPFVNRFPVPYPVLLADLASPFATEVALPTTILVDRQGRAAKTYVGAVRESVFRADVDSLLAESVLPPPLNTRRSP
jgi:cytochrome c biogenesis protein CcmG/thiol:disulfide interchange protein DsbE